MNNIERQIRFDQIAKTGKMSDTISIPFVLGFHLLDIFGKKDINSIRVYLYIKRCSHGVMCINKKHICENLSISQKSLDNALLRLEQNGLIEKEYIKEIQRIQVKTYNKKWLVNQVVPFSKEKINDYNKYFIVPSELINNKDELFNVIITKVMSFFSNEMIYNNFDYLFAKFGKKEIEQRYKTKFDNLKNTLQKKEFRHFILTLNKHLHENNSKLNSKDGKACLKKIATSPLEFDFNSLLKDCLYTKLPLSYLSKITNKSKTTISNWLTEAENCGYIKSIFCYIEFKACGQEEIKYISQSYPLEFKKFQFRTDATYYTLDKHYQINKLESIKVKQFSKTN